MNKRRYRELALCGCLWLLSACSTQANGLPYDGWRLGFGTPNYMEVWIETADVMDVRGQIFFRAMSGVGSTQSPKDLASDPKGWPERPGAGAGRYVWRANLPKLIYVRWQSLVEPQTYEVNLVIPEAAQQAMVKGEHAYCSADGKWKTVYRQFLTVGLAPGGVAKVWVLGPCLTPIEVMRVQAVVAKQGPYDGTSGGKHRPLSETAKAYVEKYGVPYGSW